MSRNPATHAHAHLEIVRWAASFGAITAEALAVRLDVTTTSARHRIGQVQRMGWLARDQPLTKRPSLYSVTREGLRACDAQGIAPARVSASNAHHMIVCAAAAAELGRAYPDYRVTGELELRRDERRRGGPVASAELSSSAGAGESRVHRPDLVMWSPPGQGGLPVAVEVELTVKGSRGLREICRAWARCGLVAGVLYLAAPEVEPALARALSETPGAERIVVLGIAVLPSAHGEASGTPLHRTHGNPHKVRVARASGW
jgi:hypothetical protein